MGNRSTWQLSAWQFPRMAGRPPKPSAPANPEFASQRNGRGLLLLPRSARAECKCVRVPDVLRRSLEARRPSEAGLAPRYSPLAQPARRMAPKLGRLPRSGRRLTDGERQERARTCACAPVLLITG